MNIGIIGAGEIGSALASNFKTAGHTVRIANSRGPDTLADVAQQTGAQPVLLSEVIRGVDLIVLTIPFGQISKMDNSIFHAVPDDVVIVETGNYSPLVRDERNEAIEDGMTETEWISNYFGRPVIKAFNNLIAKELRSRARAPGDPERIAIPVAGNDLNAKMIVMKLVEETGFDAVDGGTAEDSWRQQLGSPVASAATMGRQTMIEALASTEKGEVAHMRERLLGLVQSGEIDPYA